MRDNCKNCGAPKGLHHYQTMQCPVGGREAPIGQKEEWMTLVFVEDDDKDETIAAQAATIKRLENHNRKMLAALQLIGNHFVNAYTIPELRQIAKDAARAELEQS
jgi:RNA polymerase subunit RPABC4/transcription elongation factor Spt4